VSSLVSVGPGLALALGLLVTGACLASWWGGLGHARGAVVAAVRAVLQLAAVAGVLAAAVESLPASLAFVAVMHVVAAGTAARRLVRSRCGWWCALPVSAGPLPVVALLLGLDVVPPEGVALVPVSGILVGGAMTATVLAGRRGLDDLQARRGEVEAALSLGFEQRDAGLMVARPAASEALVPGLDQTRTVGLVALPGAFVGTLLGGASPLQAGAVQLLVLVALLLVQALAVVLTVELLARGVLHR
jgi:putative ABC transport system permease protein